MLKLSAWRFMVAAVVLCALLPTRSLAWNFVGHEVITRIAWDQLTPDAKQQVRQIIRQHPAWNADLLKHMPDDFGDQDLYAFLVAASWPDVIRADRSPWHALHRPTWHYINIPFILDGTNRAALKGADRASTDWTPGTEPDNLVQALAKCEHDLRDPNLPGPQKAIALSWFIHLAGDAHQPLHANTLFSDKFPAGDKGGNGSTVKSPVLTTQPSLVSAEDLLGSIEADNLVRSGLGLNVNPNVTTRSSTGPATLPAEGPINLHTYWDNIFGRFGAPRVLDALQGEITTEYPPSSLRDKTAILNYATWADESNDFAVRDVRRNGLLATANSDDLKKPNPPVVPPLPADYLARAQEVCRLRSATAGYRIANELNDIFGAAK